MKIISDGNGFATSTDKLAPSYKIRVIKGSRQLFEQGEFDAYLIDAWADGDKIGNTVWHKGMHSQIESEDVYWLSASPLISSDKVTSSDKTEKQILLDGIKLVQNCIANEDYIAAFNICTALHLGDYKGVIWDYLDGKEKF